MLARTMSLVALPFAVACVGQSGMNPVGSPSDPTSTTTTTSGVMFRTSATDGDRRVEDARLLREEEETAERQQRWADERQRAAQALASTSRADAGAGTENHDAFEHDLRSQLGVIDSDVDDLRAKIAQAPVGSRDKAVPALKMIAVKRAQLEASQKRLHAAVGAEWQTARADTETLLADVKRVIKETRDGL